MKVFIEASAHSNEKGIYHESTFERKGTRETLLPYPYPYGFITGTCGEDGEAIDSYIITSKKLKMGELVECIPVGYMEFYEDAEEDHKIISVLPGENYELSKELHDELKTFIYGIFKKYPDMNIYVGDFYPREDAVKYLSKNGLSLPEK